MKKKNILLFLLIAIPLFATSQDKITKKLSNQLCICLEKNKTTTLEDMNPCFEQILLKNLEDMYKFYNVKTMDDIDFDKIGNEIAAEIAKECDYIIPYLADPINKMEKDFVPEQNLDCSKLKKGEFYYLHTNPNSMKKDTTFVSIKDEMFMERMKNGRTYSFLDIKWIDDCRFDLIFKESNDPFKSVLSEKGDKYEYEMISSTPNSYIIRMKWKKQEYKFELYRIK
jgi:hypothetical protein